MDAVVGYGWAVLPSIVFTIVAVVAWRRSKSIGPFHPSVMVLIWSLFTVIRLADKLVDEGYKPAARVVGAVGGGSIVIALVAISVLDGRNRMPRFLWTSEEKAEFDGRPEAQRYKGRLKPSPEPPRASNRVWRKRDGRS